MFEPSKSTFTPSSDFDRIAAIVLLIAVCPEPYPIEQMVLFAGDEALITSTTRSPAVCARLMVSTRFWLPQADQPLFVLLVSKLPSLFTSSQK